MSWASPGAPAPHLRPKTKKGKSPSTKQRSARRGRAHRERQEQQRQPGSDRQLRRPGLNPAAQPWRPSSLATQAAPDAPAIPSPSPTPIPSPAQQPPPTPGTPACPGVLVEAGECAGVRRREDVTQADAGSRAGLLRSPVKAPRPAAKVQRRGSAEDMTAVLRQSTPWEGGAAVNGTRQTASGRSSNKTGGSPR